MSSSIIDLHMINDLKEMVALDETFVEKLFHKYFEKMDDLLVEVNDALQSDDVDRAVNSLMDVKSRSRIVGASHVAEETAEVVNAAKQIGRSGNVVNIKKLKTSFATTRDEVVRLGLI